MARFTRLQVYQKMHDFPIVPLLASNQLEDCIGIVDACYQGGIRVFEFTNRGDFAHELFREIHQHIRRHYPDMALGIGTILDAGTASYYIQHGADFVICPNLVEEVAQVCNRRKIAWIPGGATLSEISNAEALGAEIVKLFPSQILGADFVKALKGPMPHTSIMATGGIKPTEACLKEWFEAGVTCVGMGGQLFSKKGMKTADFAELTSVIQAALAIAKQYKID